MKRTPKDHTQNRRKINIYMLQKKQVCVPGTEFRFVEVRAKEAILVLCELRVEGYHVFERARRACACDVGAKSGPIDTCGTHACNVMSVREQNEMQRIYSSTQQKVQ